jgi:hypothetical protein
MLKKPTDKVTLSAEEAEAVLTRVHQSNLGAGDARIVECVFRMYLWVAFTLQEAKGSVKRLRDCLLAEVARPRRRLSRHCHRARRLAREKVEASRYRLKRKPPAPWRWGRRRRVHRLPSPQAGTVRGRGAWVPMPIQVTRSRSSPRSPASWLRATRGPGLLARGITTCVRYLRSNWPSRSGQRRSRLLNEERSLSAQCFASLTTARAWAPTRPIGVSAPKE